MTQTRWSEAQKRRCCQLVYVAAWMIASPFAMTACLAPLFVVQEGSTFEWDDGSMDQRSELTRPPPVTHPSSANVRCMANGTVECPPFVGECSGSCFGPNVPTTGEFLDAYGCSSYLLPARILCVVFAVGVMLCGCIQMYTIRVNLYDLRRVNLASIMIGASACAACIVNAYVHLRIGECLRTNASFQSTYAPTMIMLSAVTGLVGCGVQALSTLGLVFLWRSETWHERPAIHVDVNLVL